MGDETDACLVLYERRSTRRARIPFAFASVVVESVEGGAWATLAMARGVSRAGDGRGMEEKAAAGWVP